MNHDHDGSSIDLERRLAAYLVERRMTRRELLERIATLGAAAALAPVVAACTSATATATPGAASPSATTPPSSAASATPTPEPTPAPTAESELFVYNWADYMGEDVIPSFEKATGVKVTLDFFDNYDTMYAKIGTTGGGYDIAFPTSVDIPSFVERGVIQPLMLDLIPNRSNLGAEWQDPGYDPGNAHSMPYMWWTTGVAYDSDKVPGAPDSWDLLWNADYKNHIAVLDDSREAFAAALFRLGKDVNTTNDADLDAALGLLQEQKPLVRIYTTDDIGVLSSGDAWVCHAWGSDVYQVVGDRPSVKFYIPREGGVRGSDTAVVLSGAKHPVAANLFINHLLDAKVSAANTNFIGYMGPNAAAKEYIDAAILADPNVNPDQAVIVKLQELLDLGVDLEKYTSRWNRLRAGN
jgi:spermidine/putrescine transport system substrate-binding protein